MILFFRAVQCRNIDSSFTFDVTPGYGDFDEYVFRLWGGDFYVVNLGREGWGVDDNFFHCHAHGFWLGCIARREVVDISG